MDTETNMKHFISYNIISLIRDELPQDKKQLFLELPSMKEIYKDTLLMLLEKDVESLSLIRTCDYKALIELHKMIVDYLPNFKNPTQ
tara:strand:- start:27 stop:287 length:261 start_codon:yes stop_codon:yes gene_type:complete